MAHTWEIGSLVGAGVEKVFAGTIVDGTGSSSSTAATNITKLGAGTLTLAGSNTYRGNTTVSAGTLKLTNSLALQNSNARHRRHRVGVRFFRRAARLFDRRTQRRDRSAAAWITPPRPIRSRSPSAARR